MIIGCFPPIVYKSCVLGALISLGTTFLANGLRQDFPPEDSSLGDVKGDSAAGDRNEGAAPFSQQFVRQELADQLESQYTPSKGEKINTAFGLHAGFQVFRRPKMAADKRAWALRGQKFAGKVHWRRCFGCEYALHGLFLSSASLGM